MKGRALFMGAAGLVGWLAAFNRGVAAGGEPAKLGGGGEGERRWRGETRADARGGAT